MTNHGTHEMRDGIGELRENALRRVGRNVLRLHIREHEPEATEAQLSSST